MTSSTGVTALWVAAPLVSNADKQRGCAVPTMVLIWNDLLTTSNCFSLPSFPFQEAAQVVAEVVFATVDLRDSGLLPATARLPFLCYCDRNRLDMDIQTDKLYLSIDRISHVALYC